jgi:hypothetical protein
VLRDFEPLVMGVLCPCKGVLKTSRGEQQCAGRAHPAARVSDRDLSDARRRCSGPSRPGSGTGSAIPGGLYEALQGVGSALATPTALALVTSLFAPGAERVRALSIWGDCPASVSPSGSCSAASSPMNWTTLRTRIRRLRTMPGGMSGAVALDSITPNAASSVTAMASSRWV